MFVYRFCPLCATELTTGAEDERACPQGHFIKYADVSACANVIPVKDGKVLLGRRDREPFKGSMDIIGGFVVPGETGEEAAHREALEETGCEFKIGELFGTYPDEYRSATQDKHVLALVYFAELVSGEPKAADDVADLAWYDLDNLPDEFGNDGFPVLKRFKEDLIKWHQSR